MKNYERFAWCAGLYAAGMAVTAWAAPLKIELPPESVVLKNAPGAEIVAGQCLLCHSAEYITTQPPLARAAWKASVEKMQLKYGAPVPAEQVEKLVDYLAKTYGSAPAVAPGK